MKSTDLPKLRWPLDLQKIRDAGEEYLVIQDPEGLAAEPLILPFAFQAVLSRLNGSYSVADILQEGGPYGLTEEMLRELLDLLGTSYLLESAESKKRMADKRLEFAAAPLRPLSHAGSVYASDPVELRKELGQYITDSESVEKSPADQKIRALICPHIDYHRGWRTYGTAYKILEQVEIPDVIFLIGTSHQAGKSLFQLTFKDFQTPFGVAVSDKDIVTRLSSAYGTERSFRDEYLHRKEHSLELQLPWLGLRFGSAGIPKVVPILVGSFHHLFNRDRSPKEDPEVADFVGALAEIVRGLRAAGKTFLFYAGIDLAHMGQFFGDAEFLSGTHLEEIRHRDQLLLESVLAADEEKLFEHMQEDCDARRICGYPSMYTMLAAMRQGGQQLRGVPVDYRQAVDTQSDCIVTFASAYWRDA